MSSTAQGKTVTQKSTLTAGCLLSGEPSSSGPQPSSGGRPARSAGHRQADTAPSTSKAAATADANGGSKRRLVVKPPRQQPDRQEEDSRASSSSEAEISDSDDSHERRPRIKLTIKGRSSHKSKDQAASAPQDSAADLTRAQKVVKGVLKLKAAAPFSRPVNEEEVPGYGAAVKQPMDLGSVLEKLKNAEYTSLGRECYFSSVLQQSVLHWVLLIAKGLTVRSCMPVVMSVRQHQMCCFQNLFVCEWSPEN